MGCCYRMIVVLSVLLRTSTFLGGENLDEGIKNWVKLTLENKFLPCWNFIFFINSSLIARISYLKFHNGKGQIKCNIIFNIKFIPVYTILLQNKLKTLTDLTKVVL